MRAVALAHCLTSCIRHVGQRGPFIQATMTAAMNNAEIQETVIDIEMSEAFTTVPNSLTV